MIFVSLGLGQLLMMGRDLNDMSQVIAVMILIVAIGYIVDGLIFRTFERRLQYKWGLNPSDVGAESSRQERTRGKETVRSERTTSSRS